MLESEENRAMDDTILFAETEQQATGCFVGCYYYGDSCYRDDCRTTNNKKNISSGEDAFF